MKLEPVPQNIKEWIALKADLVPVPLAHSHICFMLSKAILEAFKQNVFETFKDGEKNARQAAADLKINERALKSLLNVLISTGYFDYKNGNYKLNGFLACSFHKCLAFCLNIVVSPKPKSRWRMGWCRRCE